MLRTTMLATVGVAIGAAAVLGANQLRGGNQRSQPDFVTGSVTVTIANEPGVTIVNEPAVTVLNEPTVIARQAGSWTVSLSDQPVLVWTTPAFLRVGATYTFNWPGGGSEERRVVAVGTNGWVQVDTDDDQTKWLNTSVAMSIEASTP